MGRSSIYLGRKHHKNPICIHSYARGVSAIPKRVLEISEFKSTPIYLVSALPSSLVKNNHLIQPRLSMSLFRKQLHVMVLAGLDWLSWFGHLGSAVDFRPSFHFVPEQNWMNEPNGLIKIGTTWRKQILDTTFIPSRQDLPNCTAGLETVSPRLRGSLLQSRAVGKYSAWF